MKMNFYNHIKNQLQLSPYTLEVKDDVIILKDENNELRYSEKCFFEDSIFSDADIQLLTQLSQKEDILLPNDFCYFKCWYLITHEKYFKEDLELDKYDRIGISNLRSEFNEILKVPIADILILKLQEKIGGEFLRKTNFYLTCDFDHLNIWDAWGLKDFIREVIYSAKELKIKKLKETIFSYFFSRKIKGFNYHLNEGMYSYNSIFKNLGFFITSNKQGFDGKFNYSNNITQQYINELKKNNVELGLHTSFYTYDDSSSIMDQKNKFEEIFQLTPLINRHHYLRFIFPTYLETLETAGIQKDFSIYFPENMLFRCGTSSRFIPWNEKENRPFKIELYPITLMDGTFTDYLNCNYDEAKELAMNKIKLSIKYSTDIVLLWHNRSTYKNSNIKNNYHPELINYLKEEIIKLTQE